MCKILVVDDNTTAVSYYKAVINKLHHIADTAIHGKDALELLDNNKYDLILIDLEMPVMDGLTTIRHIRKRNKKIPIILVTAYSEKSKLRTAINNGANDIFLKPLTMNKLEFIINNYTHSYAKAS